MIADRLLIHSCIYSRKTGTDRNGNSVFEETELTRVRITPVFATVQNSNAETKADKLTLFYCPPLSEPNVTIKELDCIKWNGKEYTIRSVTPCYTKDTFEVNHYEIALV